MRSVEALQWSEGRPGYIQNPNQLTERVIGAAIKIHRRLGPGLLESAYETCLAFELRELGLQVEQVTRLASRTSDQLPRCRFKRWH
jgi:GxxExxY protein